MYFQWCPRVVALLRLGLSKQYATGNRQVASTNGKYKITGRAEGRTTENGKPETGNGKRETGNGKPETENRELETGNWKQGTGNRHSLTIRDLRSF
jgi:hypothetical protein